MTFAATVMNADRWDAGPVLMYSGGSAGWRGLVESGNLARANQEAIRGCAEMAAKAKKAQRSRWRRQVSRKQDEFCVKPTIKLLAIAAIAAGIVFTREADDTDGKAIFDPDKYPRAHFQWCMKRYFTYRALDNTYSRSDGRRVQCISPFLQK